MSAKQILSSLKKLTQEGNTNLFRRVELASQLLKNAAWIAEFHDADPWKAAEALESEFFAMLGGDPNLMRLVKLLDRFPTEAHWQKFRYNVRAMIIDQDEASRESESKETTPTSTRRRVTRAEFDELAEEKADLEYSLKRERETAVERDDELARLRGELFAARQRIDHLEGEVAALRSLLREAAAA